MAAESVAAPTQRNTTCTDMSAQHMMRHLFVEAVLKMGKRASDEVYKGRMDVCSECPKKGTVYVAHMMFDGCTECGCPFETKARMLTIRGEKITCPHPDGDKWANIV